VCVHLIHRAGHFVSTPLPENPSSAIPANLGWRAISYGPSAYTGVPSRPSLKMLFIAGVLFFLTLCTCLVAGTQFAVAYTKNQAVSLDEFLKAFTLLYKHPRALTAGLPFALTLLTILLAHELGHFFACRHHHIRASYPFFIPFPSLMGTFGAFILIRSPIRTARALFDVGASGPLVGFILAVPALAYGVLHAKFVPGLDDTRNVDLAFGTPLLLRVLAAWLHPGVSAGSLLLHPVGRAAWVGLFATSLNLLPVAQLDGGHILRSLSARVHYFVSVLLPFALVALGIFGFWEGWYIWGALLFGMRFLRIAPIYDPTPLDTPRLWGALFAFLVFLLCFMPAPLYFSSNPH
jgi:membrane-associated protease RseP (regulator of RpoE activity)